MLSSGLSFYLPTSELSFYLHQIFCEVWSYFWIKLRKKYVKVHLHNSTYYFNRVDLVNIYPNSYGF